MTASPKVLRSKRRRSLASTLVAALALSIALVPGIVSSPAFAESDTGYTSVEGGASAPFYIYLKTGEYLYVDSTQIQGSVRDQSGASVSDTGDGKTYGPAAADGVWQVDIGNMTGNPSPDTWTIEARRSDQTTAVLGRVWSDLYMTTQFTNNTDDFTYWAVNDMGYVYEVTFDDYNGVFSRIRADAVGNTSGPTECTPLYSSQESRLDEPGNWNSIPDCGGTYRIFFDQPAADLPAQASIDGELTWIKPDPLQVSELPSYGPDFARADSGSTSQAGTFSWSLDSRFTGAYWLEIDADGNGVYDFASGSVDRRILVYADGSGNYEYNFDGLNGLGEPMLACDAANARLYFDKVGEIHFVQDDVEGRAGGISAKRTNGPNAPDSTIYWDDTQLAQDQVNTTPVLDGRSGVDSTVGVHGWDFDMNSWGNDRVIEDWAYALVDYPTSSVPMGSAGCLSISKSSDADEESRQVGDVVNYEVTLENTGTGDYTQQSPASLTDELAAVLDDATWNDDAVAEYGDGSTAPAPTLSGTNLNWSGALANGQKVTLRYSVTLTGGGDRQVINDACVSDTLPVIGDRCGKTTTRMPALQIAKSADHTVVSAEATVVTYTVRVTNPGPGEYTAQTPATMTDDLSAVLDDATLVADSVSASTGTATVSDGELIWSGELAAEESADITYSVTYTAGGDQILDNTACVPEAQVAAGSDACASVTIPGSALTAWKEAKGSADPLAQGDTVEYTLWFENTGAAAADVDYTDMLTYVLDDAQVIVAPAQGEGNLTATQTDDRVRIVGELAAGERASITYTVQILPDGERGDDLLVNHLMPGGTEEPPPAPLPDEPCVDSMTSTCNPVGELTVWKSVDPGSGMTLRPGDTATYTLHFENTGQASALVNKTDVLTDVLDDATVTVQPTATSAGLSAGPIVDDRFSVTGTLAAGESAEVTYIVTVNPDGQRGDDRVANFLVGPGETPAEECTPADSELPQCTVNHVSSVAVVKSSDPSSGTTVSAGQTVTYTLTFTNLSRDSLAADAGVDYTDHLNGVLDDADLVTAVESSDAALMATTTADSIRVTGALKSGQSVRVVYSVKVRGDEAQGDGLLKNVVAITGETPVCEADSQLCTLNPVTPQVVNLAHTGGGLFAGLAAVLLLGGGGVLLSVARRRRRV